MAATKPAFNPPGKKGDIIFSVLVKLAALIVLLMLGGIIVSLIISSWPSIQKFGLAFLWTKEWDAPNDIYGALVPIYGTLVTSFIALLIAVPVSFGIALFLTELAPGWLKRPLGIAIELLAAIPSIVYGMWGLFIFAPLFAARTISRYLDGVVHAQTALGFLQDVDIAHQRLSDWTRSKPALAPAAAFVLGWHAPRYARLRRRILRECAPLLEGRKPW